MKITDKVSYEKSNTNITVKKALFTNQNIKKVHLIYIIQKEIHKSVPIVFGYMGGYVGGDKEGVKEYATYLADRAQVAVVSLNYEWAPSLNYPGQVKQVEAAYNSIKKNDKAVPNVEFLIKSFSEVTQQVLKLQDNFYPFRPIQSMQRAWG
ncbi:alpha/beta hydrolase [Enterococcus wangshanyuanii]|uniref:alpha/beta hydrolase n=1 Tax=Enterococcus wangshanyuanii TaxID=2005703 RepID=UPI003AB0D87C